jgi:protein-S-isoprenylcysteine O-methyltransferase Ste14
LFIFVVVASSVVMSMYLRRVNPDIIAARVNRHEGTKSWDRWVVGLIFTAMSSILLVSALDDARYHWSGVLWWVCGIGYVLLLVGFAGVAWAESVNKHFEPTVRIQTERGHTVVNSGPYAIVRHPGYVAAGVLLMGMPLCLGSYWAFIPGVLSFLILVVRTVLEDRTLHNELPGYAEYARRVRYRLFPGIW